MEQNKFCSQAGMGSFFLSGLCSVSTGIVVAQLQAEYGFSYELMGTLLSLFNIGNLAAGFLTGLLPAALGTRATILLLGAGYAVGYALMGLTGAVAALLGGFLMVGLAKGCAINTCTILVGDHVPDRTKGMNLMHGCFACGAFLSPFILQLAGRISSMAGIFVLATLGLVLWLLFAFVPLEDSKKEKRKAIDWSFLKNRHFWLLTGLIFCQNGTESSVSGWVVTYFKDTGLISPAVSPFTVSIMWGTMLAVRFLLAFVFPVKNKHRVLLLMSIGCFVFYTGMMLFSGQILSPLLLFAFALSIAGLNPTAVSDAGNMMTPAGMGVMLPVASLANIIMQVIIGAVSENVSLRAGMGMITIPCLGMVCFAAALLFKDRKKTA
ncbi:MAG: MFS transporter [Lachnospiraceae bacterium]|nr:MFS transporter [Lachnospiraceae bacterium]